MNKNSKKYNDAQKEYNDSLNHYIRASSSSTYDKFMIEPLEKRLCVERGFLRSLLREQNDWSFIIKLHSLMETAVSFFIYEKIGNHKLEKVFHNIPMSNEKGGKIDFLQALGGLNFFQNFIRKLSKIRNHYVHKISNINLKLEDYLQSDKESLNTLANIITMMLEKSGYKNKKVIEKVIRKEMRKETAQRMIIKSPRSIIWSISIILFVNIYMELRPSHLFVNLPLRDTSKS